MSWLRRLAGRVVIVVAVVLLLEAAGFLIATDDVRSEALLLGYHQKLELLEATGALDRCDRDPEAFELELERGVVIPIRPNGLPWAMNAAAPDLSAAIRDLSSGGYVKLDRGPRPWRALVDWPRAGPCRHFYLTPPPPKFGMPFFRIVLVRLVLAVAIVLALIIFVVRPVTNRIEGLARETRGLGETLAGAVGTPPGELGEIAQTINMLADKARHRLDLEVAHRELVQELYADLAHDVRTPLASLKLSTDALAHGEASDEVAVALRAEVEYLDAMFANLATIARLRSKALPIERSTGDLRELVERVRDRFSPLARDRELSLDIAAPGEAVFVSYDPLTMQQALGNVVHNALGFASSHVAIVLSVEEGRARLRVLDDGPGIRPSELARLTERRYRSSDQGGRTGLGLGLSIAEQIVQRHDGTLDLRPYDEGGTEVTLTIATVSNNLS